jgi:hypothetical protein
MGFSPRKTSLNISLFFSNEQPGYIPDDVRPEVNHDGRNQTVTDGSFIGGQADQAVE